MKHTSTTELGFTFPCDASKVTEAKMKKYKVSYIELWQDCKKIIDCFEIDCKNSINEVVYKRKAASNKFEDYLPLYKKGLERFLYSDISVYDTTFLGIKDSHNQSICALAVPLDNLIRKARKLVNL